MLNDEILNNTEWSRHWGGCCRIRMKNHLFPLVWIRPLPLRQLLSPTSYTHSNLCQHLPVAKSNVHVSVSTSLDLLSRNWHYWSFFFLKYFPPLRSQIPHFPAFPPSTRLSHFKSPVQAYLLPPNHHTDKFLLVSPSSSILFPHISLYTSLLF